MDTPARATEFFTAGGTLHPNAPSYIKRPADDELYQQLLSGQFCYLLTSRQRGKSSLMIRTAERLRQVGIKSAIVDLSGLGTQLSREQWYLGIVKRLAGELGLAVDAELWWRERAALGPVQRFTDFLHDMVLAELAGRIVIFIDEIDTTLKLDFSDDFFAAIRAVYNLRANHPEYDRLTFVLLGVAAPTDLIKDRNRTPFNIGSAIDLTELSRSDAQPLQAGLEQLYPGQGQRVLDRIFYWTNGHPYLTQKLCGEIAEQPREQWSDETIDALVHRLFLTEDARKESNLQFVRSSIEASPERRQLLRLYQRVYEGRTVAEDERSALQKRLTLSGLIRVEHGALQVRNEIYRRVFDQAWIKANTPIDWTRIGSIGAVVVALVALVATIAIVQQQRAKTVADQVVFAREQFQTSGDADVKMSYLAVICNLQPDQAQHLFFDQQSEDQQAALFNSVNAHEASDNLIEVVTCLYPFASKRYGGHDGQNEVIARMSCALHRAYNPDAEQLRKRIGYNGSCEAQ
jgi:hypothetical protein